MFWYHAVDQLRITIDEAFHGSKFKKVENSALLAGFKNKRSICDRLFEYYADKLDYQEYVFLGAKRKLSHHEEEFNFLHKRINSINAQLQYMKERFEINFGENEELILNIKEDVRYFEHEYDKKIRSLL